MDIFLIRHTTPAVAKGICYGQTDLEVTASFEEEAAIIRQHVPAGVERVYTSPLQRCSRLALHLFPHITPAYHPELMELHCGEWEMQHWDAIPKEVLDPWMKDFVHTAIPGGESYVDLYKRVTTCFQSIVAQSPASVALVAHGGVLRSILSFITQTPLQDSFAAFSLHYGCVVKLSAVENGFSWTMLSNIPTPAEQHKPSQY